MPECALHGIQCRVFQNAILVNQEEMVSLHISWADTSKKGRTDYLIYIPLSGMTKQVFDLMAAQDVMTRDSWAYLAESAAGVEPLDSMPGRQPLPGLPEDLAAATSLPPEGPALPQHGAAPLPVQLLFHTFKLRVALSALRTEMPPAGAIIKGAKQV